MSIGYWIRYAREAQEMTQSDLAVSAGRSLRTVVRVEQGEDMNLSTLRRIAAALNTPIADLLPRQVVVIAAEVSAGWFGVCVVFVGIALIVAGR